MLAIIRRGLGGLTRFSGREPRRQFWPWFGFVFGLMMLASWLFVTPLMMVAISNPNELPDIGLFTVSMMGSLVGLLLMLAASIARRLHDSDLSAYFGLMPVPFIVFAAFGFPRLMTDFTTSDSPNLGLFAMLMVNNMIYLAVVAVLIILLVRKSTPGPNRYGEQPA